MKQKKRILYITELLSPYRVDWINELSKNFDITCFYYYESESTRTSEWLLRIKKTFKAELIKTEHVFGTAFSKECLLRVKKEKYDLYIVDGYGSLIQCKLINYLSKHNKKVFVNVDGIDLWKKESFLGKIKNKIKNKIYRSGAVFLCGSSLAATHIIDNGAKKENVYVHKFTSLHKGDIISPLEKEELKNKLRKEIGLSQYKIVVAVGRFIKLKRYEDLLYAWKNMPNDFLLFLIGGGELKDHYQSIINSLNLNNVKLIDFLGKEELNRYYLISDLFVHTSETETWGLVINEAMAKGCPCIATKHCVAGVELIKDDYNGYLIDVGDAEDLHKKIVSSISDANKNKFMSENALKTIKDYNVESLAIFHTTIFEKYL